ncbi:hypothetical protein MTO96_044234, partial [Rhipicephalus appendiculatus]
MPPCEQLRVALWQRLNSVLDQPESCHHVRFFEEKLVAMTNLSMVVKFEDLSEGNYYCVKVTPVHCHPDVEYITRDSKVIQLPP